MDNGSRTLFIFNPVANKGRAARKEQWLKVLLSGRTDSVLITTTHAGHAGDIARSKAAEYCSIIACGGDGTLHEVANAVAGKDVRIGVLPIGSANDFIKTLYFNKSLPVGVEHFFSGGSVSVDLGSVSFGNGKRRSFINSLGIGFTGRIAKRVKQIHWWKGELVYVYAVLMVLFGYKPIKMRISIVLENSLLELYEPVFAFSVMNGKIEGGKFELAPSADVSDGLLDVCILKAIPKYAIFGYLLKYLHGTHVHDSKVLCCKAKAVEVMLEGSDVMHLDGEVIDDVSGRIAISVVPGGVAVLQSIM